MTRKRSFQDIYPVFFGFYNQGQLTDALTVVEAGAKEFPEQEPLATMWQACLHARLDNPAVALSLLQQIFDRGFWIHENAIRNESDLATLQEMPAFQDLAEKFATRRQQAIEKLEPVIKVSLPDISQKPWPVIVCLHGNSSNGDECIGYWESAAKQGWLVASIQSSQADWISGHYHWNDVEKAIGEIKDQMQVLFTQYPIDLNRIIFGGMSMGGQMALRMAFEDDTKAIGYISVEPWVKNVETLKPMIETPRKSNLKGCLVAGKKNEEYLGMAQKIQSLILSSGMECVLSEASNEYHGYPDEFEDILKNALALINRPADSMNNQQVGKETK